MYTIDSATSPRREPGAGRVGIAGRPGARRLWNVVALYAVSRVFSTTLLAIALWIVLAHGVHLPSYTESPAFLVADGSGYRHDPNLFTFSGLWDGEYYRLIAMHGYPLVLPTDAGGNVMPNPWAFLPAYPALVHVLALATGLGASADGFFALGALVSMLCGGVAAVLLYVLVHERVGHGPAWFAAAVFSFGPLAFLLQVTYAESMFFALMFTAMLLLQRGRYGWLMLPAVVAAFTRPGELAIPLALAIVFVVRLRDARWGKDTHAFSVRDRVTMLVAGAVTAVAGLAWPEIATAVTGVHNAYLRTELSWRTGFLGHAGFYPFASWFELGGRYLGMFGICIVLAAVGGFVWWMTRASTRRLGIGILAPVVSYLGYLFAVFLPQQSFFRVAIPAAPLLGDPALSARPWSRRLIFWGGMALQPACVAVVWYLANP